MFNFKRCKSIATKALIIGSAIFLLSGCSSKQEQREYNKPADYWYNKMIDEIAFDDIDAADDTFSSLQSEHKNSHFIPTALQILANAHIKEEQYLLANYYLDEYTKRYALSKNIDYIRYLKIKANFLSIPKRYREQDLVSKTILETENFKKNFPNSVYLPLVDTINLRLYMAQIALNKEIAELYERVDKPKAAKIYTKRLENSGIDKEEIEPASLPWYQDLFE